MAGMGLVDDDSEAVITVFVPDGIQNEWKLLHGSNDNLLPILKEGAQVLGVLGMAHHGAYLGKLPNSVPDLPIENPPVRDYYDRIEEGLAANLEPN